MKLQWSDILGMLALGFAFCGGVASSESSFIGTGCAATLAILALGAAFAANRREQR